MSRLEDRKGPPPKISVLLPVHNGAPYLREAIDSVLGQSFGDFELIVIDDESTDETPRIIASYGDWRVRPIRVPHGGLVNALNAGFKFARGEYIARMDADDRSLPDRLAIQSAYLDRNADIDIVCSDIYVIGPDGRRSGTQVQQGLDNALLRDALLYRTRIKPVIHPSVMMRRSVLDTLGGYRHFTFAEDHDLWLRAVDRFGFARLNAFLLEYRIHNGGITRTKGTLQATASAMSAVNYLILRAGGIDVFAERPNDFERLSREMQETMERDVMPPALAFRNARLFMRNASRMMGGLAMLRVVAHHGRAALPGSSQRMTANLIERMTNRYVSSLNRWN